MADDADRAQQDADVYARALKTEFNLPKGIEGDCGSCGEFSLRLINNKCAECRQEEEKRFRLRR